MEPARTSCSSLVGFVADGTGCHILFILASRVYPEKTNYGHVMLPAIPAPKRCNARSPQRKPCHRRGRAMTPPDPLLDAAAAALFLLLVTGAALLASGYIHRVFSGGVSGLPGRIERAVYRFIGTSPDEEVGGGATPGTCSSSTASGLSSSSLFSSCRGASRSTPEEPGHSTP